MATKTLSVRLPLDVHQNIEKLCKERNLNKNRLLQEIIAGEGIVNIKSVENGTYDGEIPDMLNDVLIGIGGLATGTVVYHVLKNHLPKTWDDDTREIVAILSSISSGFAMIYGLQKTGKK